MLKTDLIYLSLTALTGILFYLKGRRHGAKEATREQAMRMVSSKVLEPAWDKEEPRVPLFFFRGRTSLTRYSGRGVFGLN